MSEYSSARKEEYKDHPLANFIRRDLPKIFANHLTQFENIEWRASPGLSQWADAPWLAAFDPIVTDSDQRGYYPVILFSRSLDQYSLHGIQLLEVQQVQCSGTTRVLDT